jgi:hypothetical protein
MSICYVRFEVKFHGLKLDTIDGMEILRQWLEETLRERQLKNASDILYEDVEVKVYSYTSNY